jgi:hypothetical protein
MTKVLGSHRDVHPIEWESRFIIDPGGLEDVARVLTVGYNPFAAADALQRLAILLGEQVTGRSMDAFRGWGLVDDIGPDRFWMAVNDGPGMVSVLYALENSLRLPDGSSVGVSVTCGAPQLHPGPYSTASGGIACFEVPAPASGAYTYIIFGDVAGGLQFTLT